MAQETKQQNEIIIPPGKYIFMQDGTSGRIKVHVGPTTVTRTNNDAPVVYTKNSRGAGKFVTCASLEEALRDSVVIPEGFYAVLMNPAKGGASEHPQEATVQQTPELSVGHKVIIQGPKMFSLWPGQHAQVIRGHSLRSNQYLLARVYNEKEARKNWSSAAVTAAVSTDTKEGEGEAKKEPAAAAPAQTGLEMPKNMTVGTLFTIRGTDVSFYIPPTGISIVPEATLATEAGDEPKYIRNAVSLEQLEYCILVDENGTKKIARGPAVVFPLPTQKFVADKQGGLKYRAIELTPIQGLHLKVTKAYKDEMLNREFKEGEEIFLTGADCPIYFPREEHAAIRYEGGSNKHFGIAIPSGEGRYVMDRLKGVTRIEEGPSMLLPNPTTEIIVRRILSENECRWWYPGNEEALAHNRKLKAETAKKVLLSGDKTPGNVARAAKAAYAVKGIMPTSEDSLFSENLSFSPAAYSMADSDGSASLAGDELTRSTSYTPPRTLTLDTKFEGVPRISIWTGYAVMVVDSKGKRRVEEGPKTILLGFDETLEILRLSTGKPKNTDNVLETPYLRVMNNQVTDVISVETSDHVMVQLKVSYQIDFVRTHAEQWWNIQNYVKHVCDHMRALLKNTARRIPVAEFYSNADKILAEVIGVDGMFFEQNGMELTTAELLEVTLKDTDVGALLARTQRQAVQRGIELEETRARAQHGRDAEAYASRSKGESHDSQRNARAGNL